MLLRQGVTCDDAIRFLDELTQGPLNDLQNGIPRAGTLEAFSMTPTALRYDQWVQQTALKIRAVFADPSIAARLRSGRYGHILAASRPDQIHFLLLAELGELRDYFCFQLANELHSLQERFAHHKGRTLVLDCNDVLHYYRFDKIPWGKEYGIGCVIVFPHVIVDEIDKKAYDTNSEKTQRIARGVYRLLEELQDEMDSKGYSTLADGTIVEVVADEITHVRLSNNDNEAVSCAGLLQQALKPGQVTVISRDIGMRARARMWNLRAEALPDKYLIPNRGFTKPELDEALAVITRTDGDT
jgi:PIN domain